MEEQKAEEVWQESDRSRVTSDIPALVKLVASLEDVAKQLAVSPFELWTTGEGSLYLYRRGEGFGDDGYRRPEDALERFDVNVGAGVP